MSADTTEHFPEISHAIEYQEFAGRLYNLDLTGKGQLTIRPDGPTYNFTGKKRGLFSSGSLTFAMGIDDIWNVIADGRMISFVTHQGKAGQQGRPFIFLCRDAAEATAVASLLPTHKNADFFAAVDFSDKLRNLPHAASPWTSVTNLLIAANVAVFIVMGFLGAGWIETESLMPYVFYGANNGGVTTDGEWWRLVSCMFMHYGVIHLLMNMWALFQTGHIVEKLLGRSLYALTYFGSGIIASLASIYWHGDKIWSAGASGAVFGIFGALLGFMLKEKHGLPRVIFQPMLKSTLIFSGYNILYGLANPRIDNAAHIGGFLSGIALGWLVALPVDAAVRVQKTGARFVLGLVAASIAIAAGMWFAPRFDYRLKDEMAWSETNKDFIAQEPALSKQHDKYLAELAQGVDSSVLAQWLETKVIPFYESWSAKLRQLQLAPGRVTVRRRDTLLNIFEMQIASCRHLNDGLRANDKQALENYRKEELIISQKVKAMSAKENLSER